MKKISALVLSALVTVTQIASTAQAEQYLYLPEARLYLSGGYNPFYPREGYRVCVDHDGIVPVDTSGAAKANVKLELVKTREQLYKMLHFSMSLAGSYSFAKGSASIRIDNEDMFDSDSLTWIVLFEQDYGRYVLKAPKLKPEFSKLRESDIYRACGSEIVTEATKTAMVYSLVTVKNLSESHKRELEAKFGASASGGVWSAKMSGHFHSLLKTAMELSSVSVEIKAIGGNGISNLAEIIGGTPGDLKSYINYENIPNVLSNYIKGMTSENAVPIAFTTTHVSKFLAGMKENYKGFRSQQIEQLYSKYLTAEDVVKKIESILEGEQGAAYIVNLPAEANLKASRADYVKIMNELNAAGEACLDQNSKRCDIKITELPKVTWPARNHDYFCDRRRKEAYQSGLIAPGLMDMAESHNLSPLVEIINNQASLTGWQVCGEEE